MNTVEYSYILLHVVCIVSPTSLNQLADILVEERYEITLETIQVLCESLPRRIETVGKTVAQHINK
jgi:hypothetical protein